MIPTYCIAHREPRLSAHLYDALIHTPPRADYQALVSVVAQPVMAVIAPADGLVNICGYRKIVTRRGNKPSSHRTITTAECVNVSRVDTEPHPGLEFLLCRHDFFKMGGKHRNIREQWDGCHRKQDLTDCLNLAVEMGVMTATEAAALEAEPALIEGGCSMGVFPGRLVRRVMQKVWPLYQEFARRYKGRFMKYDPVQRRCIAFLAERVETHFVLKELRQRYAEIPPQIFGCLTAAWDGKWEAGKI